MITDTLENLVYRLYSLNVQAVNQRYDEKSPDWMGDNAFATYRQFNPHVSIFQFLKDLECLHYQMCEGTIPQTKEYQQLDELINAVYRAIIHEDPNYKAAGWD